MLPVEKIATSTSTLSMKLPLCMCNHFWSYDKILHRDNGSFAAESVNCTLVAKLSLVEWADVGGLVDGTEGMVVSSG